MKRPIFLVKKVSSKILALPEGGGDKNIDIDGYSKTSPKYSIVKDKAQCFT